LENFLRVFYEFALEFEFLSDIRDPSEYQVRHHHESRQHDASTVPSVQGAVVPLDSAMRNLGQRLNGQLRKHRV